MKTICEDRTFSQNRATTTLNTLSTLQHFDKHTQWLQKDLSVHTPSLFWKITFFAARIFFKFFPSFFKVRVFEMLFIINLNQSKKKLEELGAILPDVKMYSEVYSLAVRNFDRSFPAHKIYWSQKTLHYKSRKGHAWANNRLGSCSLRNRKFWEALKYFNAAANKGHREAAFNIGLTYYQTKSPSLAKRYFLQSAQKDFPPAQFNLALLYEKAHHIAEAYKWYSQAASNGHKKAQEKLQPLQTKHKKQC